MKRIISILVSIVVLINSLMFTVFAERTVPGYQLTDQTVKKGETFSVDLSIEDNPGIVSLRFKIVYDSTCLELLEVKNKETLNGYTTPSSTMRSPYTLRWADALATSNNSYNGCIVTLKFKALKETSSIISIEHDEARNYIGQKIHFENTTAKINVVEDSVNIFVRIFDFFKRIFEFIISFF